jgi:hypothetical protein
MVILVGVRGLIVRVLVVMFDRPVIIWDIVVRRCGVVRVLVVELIILVEIVHWRLRLQLFGVNLSLASRPLCWHRVA